MSIGEVVFNYVLEHIFKIVAILGALFSFVFGIKYAVVKQADNLKNLEKKVQRETELRATEIGRLKGRLEELNKIVQINSEKSLTELTEIKTEFAVMHAESKLHREYTSDILKRIEGHLT